MSERYVNLQQQTAGSGRKPPRAGLYLETHQTRDHEPTELENDIGDVIERCYAAGVTTCEPIVDELNKSRITAPDGSAWTIASFQAEMKRLGA